MIILVPMGGKSSRFRKSGIKTNKAFLPVTNRFNGEKLPMAISALKDIPWLKDKKNKLICVNRPEHYRNGTEKKIKNFFQNTIFIHDHVMLDQAYACFLARDELLKSDELFIGACDNGFDMDMNKFKKISKDSDAVIFTHVGDSNIERNPNAHSWIKVKKGTSVASKLVLKNTISKNFMRDHATTGMFWFKDSKVFLEALEKMIWAKDTLDGKYYVDNVINYLIKNKKSVKVMKVRYHCWGTPEDYFIYEKTINYWKSFYQKINGK